MNYFCTFARKTVIYDENGAVSSLLGLFLADGHCPDGKDGD
jgi:hypothetical protein